MVRRVTIPAPTANGSSALTARVGGDGLRKIAPDDLSRYFFRPPNAQYAKLLA